MTVNLTFEEAARLFAGGGQELIECIAAAAWQQPAAISLVTKDQEFALLTQVDSENFVFEVASSPLAGSHR